MLVAGEACLKVLIKLIIVFYYSRTNWSLFCWEKVLIRSFFFKFGPYKDQKSIRTQCGNTANGCCQICIFQNHPQTHTDCNIPPCLPYYILQITDVWIFNASGAYSLHLLVNICNWETLGMTIIQSQVHNHPYSNRATTLHHHSVDFLFWLLCSFLLKVTVSRLRNKLNIFSTNNSKF